MAAARGKRKVRAEAHFETLAREGPRPVYAVDGVGVLAEAFARAVRQAVLPPGSPGADFNLDAFVGREAGLARVLDAARTLPAFAPRRLVVVKQAEPLLEKAKDDDEKALLAYLRDPSPTTTLLLVATKWDARRKLYKELEKAGAAVRFEPPSETEMPRAVAARAQELGLRVEPEAARLLATASGGDLGEAWQALERVALYVGEEAGRPIRRADVEAVVDAVPEESVFELVDALARGDRAQVARGLHLILTDKREPALKFLGLVTSQYRRLLKARAALDAGRSPRELPKLLGIPPFAADQVAELAREADVGQLARALGSIAATDRALKGGPLNDDLRVLERLALALREDRRLLPPSA